MIRNAFLALMLLAPGLAKAGWFGSSVEPAGLRCECRENPPGIDTTSPTSG